MFICFQGIQKGNLLHAPDIKLVGGQKQDKNIKRVPLRLGGGGWAVLQALLPYRKHKYLPKILRH